DHMEALKPFGDVPKKLTIEVKRSFVASRTFVRALFDGRDIVKKLMEVLPTNDCGDEFMRMTYCAHCKGITNIKPCLGYCHNVFETCLFNQSQVNKDWNNYVEALLLLITRLETSFNIEPVMDPIHIKISEAIMNFQENGVAVSQKLFDSCGKPRIGKRSATNSKASFNKYDFNYATFESRPVAALGSKFDRLLQDVKRKIKRTKDFWLKLPESMCSHSHLVGTNIKDGSLNCWNGTDILQ
ncbi:Glypican-6-like protein, partial [Dinothrombium tinctorium]